MGRRRCCCPGECFVFADTFAEGNTTDLGSDWNEVSGDWGILSQELVEDYSDGADCNSGATLICTQPVPIYSAGEMYVQIEVQVADLTVGDVYKLYPCCTSTSDTGGVTATYTYLGDYLEDGLKYWQIDLAGGVYSGTVISQVIGTPTQITLYVCADGEVNMVRGGIDPSESKVAAWIEYDPGSGRYAGLGHAISGKLVILDNFEMGELRIPTEVCAGCFCMCDLKPMPIHLTGTFLHTWLTDATRMDCLEGITFDLDYEPGLSGPIWTGFVDIDTVESPPVTLRVSFTLACTAGWTFDIAVTDGGVPVVNNCFTGNGSLGVSVQAKTTGLYQSTCDPLSLVYGPWLVASNDACNWCYEFMEPLNPCHINPGGPIGGVFCQGEFWIFITA